MTVIEVLKVGGVWRVTKNGAPLGTHRLKALATAHSEARTVVGPVNVHVQVAAAGGTPFMYRARTWSKR